MTEPIQTFPRPSVPRVFLGVILACVAVQLAMLIPAWDGWVMLHGALWPDLLGDVRPREVGAGGGQDLLVGLAARPGQVGVAVGDQAAAHVGR